MSEGHLLVCGLDLLGNLLRILDAGSDKVHNIPHAQIP